MRHGGALLIDCLLALGATKAFGVPGESFLAALDAMHDTKGQLDFVNCRNEGGAGFMAAAWGKLTGDPGIAFVTRGPGVTNASIGIHTAMQDSAPMLIFVGQVGTDMRGREAFQEIDYRAVFGSMAKWVCEIDAADRIPEIVSRAWTVATTGRPGPVVLALPEDMLSGPASAPAISGPLRIAPPAPNAAALDEARERLTKAKRPVIVIGGSNWTEAGRAGLRSFAEGSDIPVVAAFRYQDQFDNHSKVFTGEAGVGMPPNVRKLLSEADVILALNIRFGEMTTDAYSLFAVPDPAQDIIHIHPSAGEIGKIYRPVLGLVACPNATAEALSPVSGDWADWRRAARAAYEDGLKAPAQPSPVDMAAVTEHLRGVLSEDVILTNGAGNFSVWPNKFFPFGPKARLLAPQSGAMGYGLPAAIAASVAHPGRQVVCFAGDGDFQMNCQELATAREIGASFVVLVVNNKTYGTIRAHQERNYPERVSGTDMMNPDFAAMAQAAGLFGERVERTEDFPAAFERACAAGSAAVLDLDVAAEALTPRQTLSEMRAAALSRRSGG